MRRRALGAPAHEFSASSRRRAGDPAMRVRQGGGDAGAARLEGVRLRGDLRAGRPGGDRDAQLRGMGRAPAGRGDRPAAADVHRAHRRRAGGQMAGGKSPARQYQGARSHAHHRRAGVRPDAGRARRRRHAGDFAQAARDPVAGDRHRPRQAVDPYRFARGRGTKSIRSAAARGGCGRAGLPAGRPRRARLRPAGRGAHPAGHRLRLALRLRP